MTYPPHGGPGFGPGHIPNGPNGPFGPFDPATVAFQQAQHKSQRRLTLVLAAIATILAVIFGLALNQFVFVKTGKALIPALTLRAAGDPGPDPFTASVDLTNRVQPITTQVESEQSGGVRVVRGTSPGFYGSYGSASCDAATLGNQLRSNPQVAQAWAGAQGIRTSDIPWYLNSLTPVVLTADTWVTNHTYTSGRASAFQSVLQAGTPVMIDAAGVPRVVCSCGNPLRPPTAAPVGGYRVVGDPWAGYTVNNTYRVATNTTVVNSTTIVQQQPTATPAAAPSIQVTDLVNQFLTTVSFTGILNDLPDPPADLPDFLERALTDNVDPAFGDDEQAAANGTAGADEATAAETVTALAAKTGDRPVRQEGETPIDGAETVTAADTVEDVLDGAATDASSASGAPSTSSPSGSTIPTSVTQSGSGSTLAALTYVKDSETKSCEVTSHGSSTISTDCGLTFTTEALDKDKVPSSGLWAVTTTSGTTVEISSLTWESTSSSSSSTTSSTTESSTETTTETTTSETAETTTESVTVEETVTPTPSS